MQAEEERIIGIIQPIHQRVLLEVEATGLILSKHLSFDLVENLQKVEEDVLREIQEVMKIFEHFQGKVVPNAQV